MADLLVIAAGLFAIVAGANDGSSVLAAGIGIPGLKPLMALGILLTALIVGPLVLLGTGVASTLIHGLVPFAGREADTAVLVAILAAITVVTVLVKLGLPTSLTLALVGAIAGAGIGAGLPVSRHEVELIALLGLVAPIASALLAYFLMPWVLRIAQGANVSRRLTRWHQAAFSLQCVAYAANGGQKMFAVFALALGLASGGYIADSWQLAFTIALLFALGVLLSLPRVSTTLGQGIYGVRLQHAAVAETCSALVVTGAAFAGVPLTMSQSIAGAIVGTGASESPWRVRWTVVTRIASSWVVTLPISFLVAALAAVIARSR